MEDKETNSESENETSNTLSRETDSYGRKYMQEAYKLFCKGEKLSSPLLVETYNTAVSYFLKAGSLHDSCTSEEKE